MMDILTVLLLFLLKSFVVDGEALTPLPGLELPESTSESMPVESIHLALVDQGVLVGDELVVTIESIRRKDGYLIPELEARLQQIRLQSQKIAEARGQVTLSQRATIQGDKDLEFVVLQKVMYTLSETGFKDISLAVIKKS